MAETDPERSDQMIRSKTMLSILSMIMLLILCCLLASAQAETVSFKGLNDALKYIKKNQPSELIIESGKFKPSELIQVKKALPEGATFHFTVTWGNIPIPDSTRFGRRLKIRPKKNLTGCILLSMKRIVVCRAARQELLQPSCNGSSRAVASTSSLLFRL